METKETKIKKQKSDWLVELLVKKLYLTRVSQRLWAEKLASAIREEIKKNLLHKLLHYCKCQRTLVLHPTEVFQALGIKPERREDENL